MFVGSLNITVRRVIFQTVLVKDYISCFLEFKQSNIHSCCPATLFSFFSYIELETKMSKEGGSQTSLRICISRLLVLVLFLSREDTPACRHSPNFHEIV